MKKFIFSFSLFLLCTRAWAAPQSYSFSGSNGRNQIRFESNASVEDFDGTAEKFNGQMTMDESRANLGLKGTFAVAVDSMQTGLAMRDRHMLSSEWLDAARYPIIRFELVSSGQNAILKKKGVWAVMAKGTFTLKGHSKPITIPATITKKDNDVIVNGDFYVPIEEYGIHGPSAMKMLGLRVGNQVKVTFKMVGKREASWSNSQRK